VRVWFSLFVCFGLLAAGCGTTAETSTVSVIKTATLPFAENGAAVYIYFCTTDTCAKEATQAQISAVSRRASESPLVEKVVFISKEEALAILRRKHPEEVKLLPSNPLPDRLTVFPRNQRTWKRSRPPFGADPAHGIYRINYGR
jgi:cell division protein FtsX